MRDPASRATHRRPLPQLTGGTPPLGPAVGRALPVERISRPPASERHLRQQNREAYGNLLPTADPAEPGTPTLTDQRGVDGAGRGFATRPGYRGRAMDTILFDLDGTITDSARGIVDCFRHALATVGAPPPDDESLRGVVGPPIVHTFRRLGLDEADVLRARAAYRERYDAQGWAENAVYPGLPGLLRHLAASGVTLGVATSKNERMARQILRHFDIDGPFAFIGGASDDDSRIEKADVIAHTLRGLGRTPAPPEMGGTPGVVLVGDRSHDVLGAARFGIPTVLVTWGYGTPDECRTARWTASTPDELGELLDRLTAGSTVA